MQADDQIQSIVEKLNGMLWLADATEKEVKRLAALLRPADEATWASIMALVAEARMTDYVEKEQAEGAFYEILKR